MLLLISAGCRKKISWADQYSEAERKFQDGDSGSAIRIATEGYARLRTQQPLLAWKFRLLNAQALNRQHKLQESLASLGSLPANLPDELKSLTQITKASSLCGLHRKADAVALLDAAEGLLGHSRLLESQLQFSRAACVVSDDRTLATGYLRSAAKSAHGLDSYLEARALIYHGYLLMQDGRYDQAIGDFNQALTTTSSPFLKELSLGNLGYSHEKLGDWQAAPDYLQKAEDLASTVRDAAADRVLWLIDLGQVHFSQLQFSDAEKAWSKALAMARNLNDSALKVWCFNNLAIAALKEGDRSTAKRYIDEGIALSVPEEQRLYLVLTQARLARAENNPVVAEELMRQILASHPDLETRYQTQTELATLYSEQGRSRDAERMFREGIMTVEKAFAEVGSDRFRISFMDQDPFYDQYVRFLVTQGRTVDALAVAERGRSRALASALSVSDEGINLKAMQSGLKERGQIALAYWLGWKAESYLWAITPTEVKLFKLPPEKEIDDAIDAYSQEVLNISSPGESRLGQKLYEMLVAPAEKYIPKGARVIIVPHRRLYKLNFETLVSPYPKPHFWIEDVCIQNASFLAALETHSSARAHYSKDLLLMGAPVEASKDFPGLAHAPEEIEKVAEHFPRSQETVIDGAAATPTAYESSDPSEYRFLHFVTHGTASDTNPLDSAIILSRGSDGYKLYARDIIKTRIHPELVTISACYGAGRRQFSGEGLVGLAWAFMRVGAHQVIAALWEVDDAASPDLMDQFYGELTKGKSAAEALRDGKLAMLHSKGPRRRPYYWASLQLYTGR